MFYDDDVDIFFSNEDFAETMTLEGEIISAIFDIVEVLSDEGNRGQIFTREPSLTLPTKYCESIAVDQVVVRADKTKYRVRSYYHNASGVTEVSLYKDYT